MNILIPQSWLHEHLETDVTAEQFQELVSLAGPGVEHIFEREGEPVFDIEITTNRVDSMSVRGVAREAAVILTQAGHPSKLKNLDVTKIKSSSKTQLALPKITDQTKFTKRIMCVVLDNVQQAATPYWMARRLVQTEQNVHHAMIDITNYVTHELGHPCHAFDYDKIMNLGGEIIITEAQAGESFTTLDGESYQTVGGEVVYKNPTGEIIDLPAIKGTANSAVDDSTNRVLFWIESLDAKKVRFASMSHAIRTVAAQLNEKHVDPYLAKLVLQAGAGLFTKLCKAETASEVYDHFPEQKLLKKVNVPTTVITTYLGLELPNHQVDQILTDLGCQVEHKADNLVVTPPTFRPDIEIPVDVVEEIARIYGYHNLPSRLMDTPIPTQRPTDTNFTTEHNIKQLLTAQGVQEVYTYSMVSADIARQSGYDLANHLRLSNPLSEDREYLRRSLLPSLEEFLAANSTKPKLAVFEIANCYHPQNTGLPQEELRLGLVGNDYALVKGWLENLVERFHIDALQLTVNPKPTTGWQQSATVSAANRHTDEQVDIGHIGIITSSNTGLSLSMARLFEVINSHPEYQPLPTTAVLTEDMTFTLPDQTYLGPVAETIKQVSDSITQVTIGTSYQQNHTFKVYYQLPTENITSEAVKPIRVTIVKNVKEHHGGKLVGEV